MTVDEALEHFANLVVEDEDNEAHRVLCRYVEQVREIEPQVTGLGRCEIRDRIAAAREGRDDT